MTTLESIAGICLHRRERILVRAASAISSRSTMESKTSSGNLLSRSSPSSPSMARIEKDGLGFDLAPVAGDGYSPSPELLVSSENCCAGRVLLLFSEI